MIGKELEELLGEEKTIMLKKLRKSGILNLNEMKLLIDYILKLLEEEGLFNEKTVCQIDFNPLEQNQNDMIISFCSKSIMLNMLDRCYKIKDIFKDNINIKTYLKQSYTNYNNGILEYQIYVEFLIIPSGPECYKILKQFFFTDALKK